MAIGNVNSLKIADKIFDTTIRFVVNDKIKTQVVNPVDDKIIREIPIDQSSQILLNLYG